MATTSATTYDLGDLVRVTGPFTNAAGTAIDPTAVLLDVRTPAGLTTTYTYGVGVMIIKASVGNYYADINANTEGLWVYRWYSTGTGQAADEGSFLVIADIAAYAPIVLTRGEDYRMIRHYIGADLADLPAETLEEYGYLPYVEAEVTAIVTDYVALLAAGGSNAYRLKTGVAAWVAALLCQQFGLSASSGGGVQIGDYQEKGAGITDWKTKALDLMKLAAQALAAITTRVTGYERMSLVVLAGPTRSGGNVPADEEEWIEKIQPRFLDWIEEGGEDD